MANGFRSSVTEFPLTSPCDVLATESRRWRRRPCGAESRCESRSPGALRGWLSMSAAVRTVRSAGGGRAVCVQWEDGSESRYPSVWLRDSCQCPVCFLPSAGARRLRLEDLDVDIVAKQVALADSKKVFEANRRSPSGESRLTMLINLNPRQLQVSL